MEGKVTLTASVAVGLDCQAQFPPRTNQKRSRPEDCPMGELDTDAPRQGRMTSAVTFLKVHFPGIYPATGVYIFYISYCLILSIQDIFKDDFPCVQLGIGNFPVIGKGRCFQVIHGPVFCLSSVIAGAIDLPLGGGLAPAWCGVARACAGMWPDWVLTWASPTLSHCIDLPLIVLAHMPTTDNCLSQYLLPDDLI